MDILHKEGFLSGIYPGDERGPYVDILATIRNQNLSIYDTFTNGQLKTLESYKMAKSKMVEFHAHFASDGSKAVDIGKHKKFQEVLASLKSNESLNPPSNPAMSDFILLKSLSILPAFNSVYVPDFSDLSKISADDLQHITPKKDRKIWVDLRYDLQNRPAISDMFMVSRGSRKVYTSAENLRDVLTGRKYNAWKGSEIGAVTFLETDNGQIMTGNEAIKRNVGGEVLCIAK